MYNFPYLKDSNFLKRFDKLKVKQQIVKITVLSFDQKPIESIQGRVQTGSITIDGSSAMRRTGSLTIIPNETDIDVTKLRSSLSINKKIQILIGFTNITGQYTNYDILWFPQGIYVINAANISHGTNGTTINLTIHDKMALLNGECGGTLPSSVVFHERQDIDENGKVVINHPTIYQIIQELVNHFGGEQLGKIIISDIDNRIKRVMKWTGSSPLYLITRIDSQDKQTYSFTTNENEIVGETYQEFDYGMDVGYIMDDFIYPGELIGNAGDTVVTILDNIKNLLGNFEYFYDINGNFIFQEIKNYLNKSYSSTIITDIKSQDYLADYIKGKSVYVFDNSDIIQSYSNAPQYNQIKNDFIVWGTKSNSEGVTKPIRYHLALDNKPMVGNTYKVFFYVDEEDGLKKAKAPVQFSSRSAFPQQGQANIFYLALDTGIIYKWNYGELDYEQTDYQLKTITTTDFRSELYLNGVQNEKFGTESNYYYAQLKNQWLKVYDMQASPPAFIPAIAKKPYQMDFFLDFIDSPDIQFNISNIGRRTNVISDDSINCVFAPQFPDIVMIQRNKPDTEQRRAQCVKKNQRYSQVDTSIYSMLLNGGTYKSAFDEIKKQLYQYSSYNEQVSLTVLPIYYLQPNTRITIKNDQIGINGDYMINSITLPLDINGTMSMNCSRALERI